MDPLTNTRGDDGMPFIQGLSYIASSRCFRPNTIENIIRVIPVPFVGAGSGVEFAELVYDQNQQALPTVGYIAQTAAGMSQVWAFLPEEDFEVQRMLFLTASPVEIEWQTEPMMPNKLQSIDATPGTLGVCGVPGCYRYRCSVSVFESVFVVAPRECGHGFCPRVAAGMARGSTVRGPGGRGGSSFLAVPACGRGL